MKDMQANAFMDEQSAREILLGAGGALGMFSISRFFKGKDSDRKRLRDAEEAIAELKIGLLSLRSGHETLNNILENIQETLKKYNERQINQTRDIKEMNEYAHTIKHDLANMINEKTLKDGIVDDVYRKMENIEYLIKERK